MEYRRAIKFSEIEECQKLLHDIYNKENNYSLTIPDKYDEQSSTYFYCKEEGEIASTIRIVLPDPVGIPMDKVFTMPKLSPRIVYAELSRIAVKSKFQGRVIRGDMYAAVCKAGKEMGVSHFVAEVNLSPSLVPLYKRFFCFKSLGPEMHDPDIIQNKEETERPNFMPMIGSIDTFLERYIRSKISIDEMLEIVLELGENKNRMPRDFVNNVKEELCEI